MLIKIKMLKFFNWILYSFYMRIIRKATTSNFINSNNKAHCS